MDGDRLDMEYRLLETATDTAVQLTELEWRAAKLSDEDLAPEFQRMFRELKQLNERSLCESLRHTDPKALFDLVRYAKHLGMWKGYEANQHRLAYAQSE